MDAFPQVCKTNSFFFSYFHGCFSLSLRRLYLLPSPCPPGTLYSTHATLASAVLTSSSRSELNLSFIQEDIFQEKLLKEDNPRASGPCGFYYNHCLSAAAQQDLAQVCLSHLTFLLCEEEGSGAEFKEPDPMPSSGSIQWGLSANSASHFPVKGKNCSADTLQHGSADLLRVCHISAL